MRKVKYSLLVASMFLALVACDKDEPMPRPEPKPEVPELVAVRSVTLDATERAITVGETFTLRATVSPADASQKTVTFRTDKEDVATVDANGLVTAKAVGTAIITAVAEGNKVATCRVNVLAQVIRLESIALSDATKTVTAGEDFVLSVSYTPENASNKAVTWSTSNEAIATVNAQGRVTTKAAGEVTITATSEDGNKVATCRVTVNRAVVAVRAITLNHTEASIVEQGTLQLTATFDPENADDKTLSWLSSREMVATVSNTGLVTAKKEGTTIITARTANGKSATCTITVTKQAVLVSSVSLNHSSKTITVGEMLDLVATIAPQEATNKNVTWTSNNPDVASVASNGRVTAKKAGTATITVRTEEGNKTATCTITVNAGIVDPTAIVANPTTKTLKVGETFTLKYNLVPANATPNAEKGVRFDTDNSQFATVDAHSGLVTAQSVGTVDIWVTCYDSNNQPYEDFCTVTVIDANVPVTSVTLDKSSHTMNVNETVTLVATVNPSNATNKNVTWSSNNNTIATVTSAGVVTAKSAGTATITATADGKSATCTINVNQPATPPAPTAEASVTLSFKSSNSKIKFDSSQTALGRNVFIDLNGNGTQDDGEGINYDKEYTVPSTTCKIYGDITKLGFKFDNGQTTSINGVTSSKLQALSLYNNMSTTLNVDCSNLTELNLNNGAFTKTENIANVLSSLSLEKLPKLNKLVAEYCNLTTLDFSPTPDIRTIYIRKNSIKGEQADAMFNSLPDLNGEEGTVKFLNGSRDVDQDASTEAIVGANVKGWRVMSGTNSYAGK